MRQLVACLAVSAASACANLPAPGVCGNGVHEPELGEDCDGGDNCAGCRLRCDGDAPCPDGGSCGVDGLCSFPSGQLAYPATFVEYLPTHVRVMDQDGDGIGDVVGVSPFSIDTRHGSSTADLGRADGILTPFLSAGDPRPVLTEVPELGISAVLPTPDGITAYASTDGSLLPLPTPAVPGMDNIEIRDASMLCTPSTCGLMRVYEDFGPSDLGVHLVVAIPPGLKIDAPCGATALATTTPVVALRTPGGADRFAIATETNLCAYDLSGTEVDRIPLASPASRLVPLQADLDGCEEVGVVGLDGLEILDPAGCGSEAARTTDPDPLLAAGNLDGDARSELVFTGGVRFAGGETFVIGLPTAAAVGDFNRDGRGDVVTIDLLLGPSLWLGVGNRELSFRPTGFPASIERIATLDVDGDLFDDVVASSSEDDRLYVAYGSPYGLELPAIFGAANDASWLSAGSRNIVGSHTADVVAVHTGDQFGQPDGTTDVVRFRAVGRSLAPSSPMRFAPTQGVLYGDLMGRPAGATAVRHDLAVFGFDYLTSGLTALWLPGGYVLDGVDVDLDPRELPIDNSSGYFPPPGTLLPFAPALETLTIGGAPAVLAARRVDGVTEAILFRPPSLDQLTPVVPWQVELAPVIEPPGTCNVTRQTWRVRAVQFDADPDSELVVTTVDSLCYVVDGVCQLTACEPTARVHLVDFSPDGTVARSTELSAGPPPDSGDYYACTDAIPIDLGPLGPDGEPNAGPDEIVTSCVMYFAQRDANGDVIRDENYLPTYGDPEPALIAFHSRADGPEGAFLLTPTPWFGDLAAGDVTGDGLDDVILMFFGIAGVAVQCPRHDAGKCEL